MTKLTKIKKIYLSLKNTRNKSSKFTLICITDSEMLALLGVHTHIKSPFTSWLSPSSHFILAQILASQSLLNYS